MFRVAGIWIVVWKINITPLISGLSTKLALLVFDLLRSRIMAWTFFSLFFSVVAIGNVGTPSHSAWICAALMALAAACESRDYDEMHDIAKRFNAVADIAIKSRKEN